VTEAFVAEFLAGFDDSRYPADFLQNYELMECLSSNEMGETLLVIDRRTGEYCVAKCYARRSLLSNSSESAVLKQLDHAGLPRFLDEYENEEMHCVVRTYVEGLPLDRYVQTNSLTRKQAIDIAVQLCEILAYLHGQMPPIIHRDIKPQNVIINEDGKITLIDFGISRIYNEASQEDTLCFGTRYYAAPEQYGYSQTDNRADIFSLGVLLYWLLTGKVDAQEAKKSLPDRRLAKIIARCTSFAPKDRFQSARQVMDALTGRTAARRGLLISGVCLLILLAVFFFLKTPVKAPAVLLHPDGNAAFKEPLKISQNDLDSITGLYIFGDKVAVSEEQFRTYNNSFANSEGKIVRGSIRSLDDLVQLKNLREIHISYQFISDLTPLSELTNLEIVDLHHNPIEDIAPLSRLKLLSRVVLFDTNVSDLTPLQDCYRLTSLDVGLTPIQSITALDGLESLQELSIRKAPLRSLDHIETHRMLEKIYLSETQLLDLAPLLELPRLQEIEVSENMRTAAEAVEDRVRFTIRYQ
jgi:serine/threonine protein kinase